MKRHRSTLHTYNNQANTKSVNWTTCYCPSIYKVYSRAQCIYSFIYLHHFVGCFDPHSPTIYQNSLFFFIVLLFFVIEPNQETDWIIFCLFFCNQVLTHFLCLFCFYFLSQILGQNLLWKQSQSDWSVNIHVRPLELRVWSNFQISISFMPTHFLAHRLWC